jgi:NTE family protein
VIATAIVGNDQSYLERPCVRRRAIQVDTSAVGITEFDAPKERCDAVTAKGDKAAARFLDDWDWEGYLKEFRSASEEQ